MPVRSSVNKKALKKVEVLGWIRRFAALWVLLMLCAGIPLGPFSMWMGSGAVTITAVILASLISNWDPRSQLKTLLVLDGLLATVIVTIAVFL
tara:strand:- start:95 stop:373 length:279 start_codon:yes stop_codon:yes gene_type:complete